MKYGKVQAQGVTLCFTFHCFIIQVPVLCLSVKRKQKERRERDVKEERQQGGHFNFLEGY